MHAFYFGNSGKPLYGVSHSSLGDTYRDSAILLCNSIAHEYIRSHRALKLLAERLAEMGYYVLRFDYTGVGDSSGDFNTVGLSDWQKDIELATEELRAISHQEKITVIGLRVGATLSLLASEGCNFHQIIMLDPVISGRGFVKNLVNLHEQLLASRMWFVTGRSKNDTPGHEYLGFQYADKVIEEFDKLILSKSHIPESQLLSIIRTSNHEISNAKNNKTSSTFDSSATYINDMGNWKEIEFIDKSLTATLVSNHLCEILK